MPGASPGHHNLIGIGNESTGKAAPGSKHRRERLPTAIEKIKAEGGRRRAGAIQGKGTSVEKGATDDVEVRPDRNGSKVTETVGVRVTRSGREWTPGEVFGVEKVRR